MIHEVIMRTNLPGGKVRELVDKGSAAELYVDGYQGFLAVGQVCKLNLYTKGFSIDGDNREAPDRVELAARLVMSIDNFFAFAKGLNEIAEKLRQAQALALGEETKKNVEH